MYKKTAACIGDNCVDFYDATGEAFFGGNPVNVAVCLSRLGVKASYLGAVGTDDFGRKMAAALAGKGVDVSHVQTKEGKTAMTHICLEGEERILGEYEEGVMETYRLTEEDRAFICRHDAVVTGLWGHCEGELAWLRGQGLLTVFDCADRPEDPAALTAIPHTDILFFSDAHSSEQALREKLRKLAAQGVHTVVATRGEKGSLAFDGACFTECGIIPCEVIDTMGAGDSYIAGFVAAVLEGATLAECMEAGARSSSVTLGYAGAW